MYDLPLSIDQGIVIQKINTLATYYGSPSRCILTRLTQGEYQGKRFFVRENFNGIPSFYIHSNQRWSMKFRSIADSQQVLELCCESRDYEFLSTFLHDFDHLNRPVLLNIKFTARWAYQHIDKPLALFDILIR